MLSILDVFQLLFRQGIPCLFHLITGFYCPGCGGTRAVRYLLRGQVLKSIQYHPLIFYIVAVTGAEVISFGIAKLAKRPQIHLKRYDLFVYAGIVIIVANWIFKNYMLIVKGIDLLP